MTLDSLEMRIMESEGRKSYWPGLILSGIALFFIAAVLFPVFARRNERPRYGSCMSHLKQLGLAFAQYQQDYSDRLPLVVLGGSAYGWADALPVYTQSQGKFQCSAQQQDAQPDPRLSQYTDYWFDARLSGRTSFSFEEPALRVMSGDGNDGTDLTNARYSISTLPPGWIANTASPLYRHLGYANYLFADGHVKSLEPRRINANGVLLPYSTPAPKTSQPVSQGLSKKHAAYAER